MMQSATRGYWALVFGLALLAVGCGSSTKTTLEQPAYWRSPAGTKVALVSVDVDKKVLERAPSDFANMRVILHSALVAAFGGQLEVVDRTELGYKAVIAPVQKEAKKLWIFTEEAAPTLPEDQVWGAEAPKGLPAGVVEPLILAVKVLRWTLNNDEVVDGKMTKTVPAARFDLVYSLWTKAGKEVETVRIVNSNTSEMRSADLRALPGRESALLEGYSAEEVCMGDREKVFRAALANGTSWYAWPMRSHTITFYAHFRTIDDNDKQAAALCDAGKWQEALAAWTAALAANPKAAQAAYNAAMVSRVLGKDDEARALFAKACAIEDNGLFCGAKEAAEKRAGLVRSLVE